MKKLLPLLLLLASPAWAQGTMTFSAFAPQARTDLGLAPYQTVTQVGTTFTPNLALGQNLTITLG